MKTKRRWMNSAIAESRKADVKLPWARGLNRNNLKLRLTQPSSAKISANS